MIRVLHLDLFPYLRYGYIMNSLVQAMCAMHFVPQRNIVKLCKQMKIYSCNAAQQKRLRIQLKY